MPACPVKVVGARCWSGRRLWAKLGFVNRERFESRVGFPGKVVGGGARVDVVGAHTAVDMIVEDMIVEDMTVDDMIVEDMIVVGMIVIGTIVVGMIIVGMTSISVSGAFNGLRALRCLGIFSIVLE